MTFTHQETPPKVVRIARIILLAQSIFTILLFGLAYWAFNYTDYSNPINGGINMGLNAAFGLHPDESPNEKLAFMVTKLILPLSLTVLLYFVSGLTRNYIAVLILALMTFLIGITQNAFPLLSGVVLVLFLLKPSRLYYYGKGFFKSKEEA